MSGFDCFLCGTRHANSDPICPTVPNPCEPCNGSGMVAVGPWGSRPPRVRCSVCRGSGRVPEPHVQGSEQ